MHAVHFCASLLTVAEVKSWSVYLELYMQSGHPLKVLHLLHVHGLPTLRTGLHRDLKPIKIADVRDPAGVWSGYLAHKTLCKKQMP